MGNDIAATLRGWSGSDADINALASFAYTFDWYAPAHDTEHAFEMAREVASEIAWDAGHDGEISEAAEAALVACLVASLQS